MIAGDRDYSIASDRMGGCGRVWWVWTRETGETASRRMMMVGSSSCGTAEWIRSLRCQIVLGKYILNYEFDIP